MIKNRFPYRDAQCSHRRLISKIRKNLRTLAGAEVFCTRFPGFPYRLQLDLAVELDRIVQLDRLAVLLRRFLLFRGALRTLVGFRTLPAVPAAAVAAVPAAFPAGTALRGFAGGFDNDLAVRFLTGRLGGNPFDIGDHRVDNPALIGVHRLKGNRAAGFEGFLGHPGGEGL